jgi:predicted ATPase/DNA-binding XRE family transcriptional regulator
MTANDEHPASSPPFAQELRRLRLAAELTQRDLAERSGISARAISDLERGINHAPQRETARMLGDALGLTPDERSRFLDLARRRPSPPVSRSSGTERSDPDPLIGREMESALIEATLLRPGTRLVTLAGPGGVGKTRLAMEVARRFTTRYPGGVPFLRLDGLQDATLVIPTLAAAVSAPMAGDARAVRARVAAQLSAGERLVILDNLEHLLAAAPDLGQVLGLMTAGCLLVTSREALRLSAEQVIPVHPLPLPDAKTWQAPTLTADIDNPAMQLFVRRARSQRADLPLDTSSDAGRVNLGFVADLCQRLDGLPLAIELAAAQIPVCTPQAISTMLTQAGLPLLSGGARDHPARLQTMEASIAWSYGSLDATEQRAFRTLAVFSSGFGLAAAAAVLAQGESPVVPRIDHQHPHACADAAVLEMVRILTRKHLLMPDEDAPAHVGPRFRMLEPLRLFALEQLQAAGEEPLARLSHARYFTELAAVLDPLTIGAETEMRLDQQRIDLDNFRAAIDWALVAGEGDLVERTTGNVAQFWKLRGYLAEARQRMSAALRVDGQSSTTDRWFLRFWAVTFALEVGDHAGALALAEEILEIGQSAGDPFASGVGYAMLSRAVGAFPDRSNEGVALAQRAVEILEPLGRAEWTGLAWVRLGVEHHRAGQLQAARDALLRALELRRAEPFAGLVASALISLGAVWFDLGEAQAALDAFREALHLALAEENQTALLGALLGLADVTGHFGDGTPAERTRIALALAATAELRRQRHGLGREGIGPAVTQWSAQLHEVLCGHVSHYEMSAGTPMDLPDAIAIAMQLSVAPRQPEVNAARPALSLIGTFGSLQ